MTSLDSNYEGILAHAAKDNDPFGLRRVREEIAQTVSHLGTTDCIMPRTGRWHESKGVLCVPNLKITLTAAVPRNLCFKLLPLTPEEESACWVPVVSPLNFGLDLSRSHKLSSKRASLTF